MLEQLAYYLIVAGAIIERYTHAAFALILVASMVAIGIRSLAAAISSRLNKQRGGAVHLYASTVAFLVAAEALMLLSS